MIAELSSLIPQDAKVMVTYGGGSIKKNGVYDQVMTALKDHSVIEFPGIEPNPEYETCMKAVELARREQVDFLLAVGGGSVLDGTKFIAAAIPYQGDDPWKILMDRGFSIEKATPLGTVMTLPATGSETNMLAVVSRKSIGQKLAFANPAIFPKFAILDPETNLSLPARQVSNGIVDTFIHVFEQYMTYPVNAPLQDRQAEAILTTVIEEGPKAIADPENYDVRANLVWCATWALNGHLGCGVPQDWATHMIGHQLTAVRGFDHAQTLALILPGVLRFGRKPKREKLLQYAERIWNIDISTDQDKAIDEAIRCTAEFFAQVGIDATTEKFKITEADIETIANTIDQENEKIENRDKLGEHNNIGGAEVRKIFALCN
jgi:NADP-dependent alcohol dehydrogenase